MTTEELHNYNRRNAITDISYSAVCEIGFIRGLREWIEGWMVQAYEAGFKAAKEGQL